MNKKKNENELHDDFSLFQNHEIHNLEVYKQYLISIQVFNPEGMGPDTSVVVMTDEGGKSSCNLNL